LQDRRRQHVRPRTRGLGVRGWPLWSLHPALALYITIVVGVYCAAAVIAAWQTTLHTGDVIVFALLLGCGALSIEVNHRLGEPANVQGRDLLAPWTLPIVFLLPPVYALLAAVPLNLVIQLRVRRAPLHRRVFSAAAIGLAHGVAALVFVALAPRWQREVPSGANVVAWASIAAAAALLCLVINRLLIALAIKGSDPTARLSKILLDRENYILDLAELSCGVLIALVCDLSPILVVLGLLPVLLLQRSVFFAQLRAEARTDSKTGLLNAAAWEREAVGEIARAQRTGARAAVLLLDLDHFKRINDTFGHLVGDGVLRAVADVLRAQLREYDIVGRFGGEEFAILLPQTDESEACLAAERLRRHIAELGVPVGSGYADVTASIGLAVLQDPRTGVTELLAQADHALYLAKAAGRNQTWTEAARVPGNG
jgi:diguanylate cyclase (GGDEF)-like protein